MHAKGVFNPNIFNIFNIPAKFRARVCTSVLLNFYTCTILYIKVSRPCHVTIHDPSGATRSLVARVLPLHETRLCPKIVGQIKKSRPGRQPGTEA